jgi:xylulokinase
MIFLGVDVGTGSSKAVAVDERGQVLATARQDHRTSSPAPGYFEHDVDEVWLTEPVTLVRRLLDTLRSEVGASPSDVAGVAFSGIGPAVVPADSAGTPLRPGILYGIDTRAQAEIAATNRELGDEALLTRCGNLLSSQSVGPKLIWLHNHEPDVWRATRKMFCPNSYLVHRLTGEYVFDRYTASGSDPLYDMTTGDWWDQGWATVPGSERIERPRLVDPLEVVGSLHHDGAELTGLRVGTPVIAGTVDALAEGYSVGVEAPGDLMLMYGSTLFMIQITDQFFPAQTLWAVGGLRGDQRALAAGMSTGGLVTSWLAEQLGHPVGELVPEAEQSPPGSHGLVLLPYLAGERTPFEDPRARGAWVGLGLRHTRADLVRSALESVGYGIRHNIEKMAELGATPARLVAVGGGAQSRTWLQIVSDICQAPQDVPGLTVGAAYGDARMVAAASGCDVSGWNPPSYIVQPRTENAAVYDEMFGIYASLYAPLRESMHRLSAHNS